METKTDIEDTLIRNFLSKNNTREWIYAIKKRRGRKKKRDVKMGKKKNEAFTKTKFYDLYFTYALFCGVETGWRGKIFIFFLFFFSWK